MLKLLITVGNEPEAEMLCGRLSNAGIPAMHQRGTGGVRSSLGAGGLRDIYVEDSDRDRARELLNEG